MCQAKGSSDPAVAWATAVLRAPGGRVLGGLEEVHFEMLDLDDLALRV